MPMMSGFANAFRIAELRKKILITLGLVFVCRLIAQIPTPGVLAGALREIVEAGQTEGGSLLGWFDVFTGGALSQCGIGFLSIWPYISAQIVIQLLSSVVPVLEKYKREGETGRAKLAEITRLLTIVLCIAQSWAISSALMNPSSLGLPESLQLVANPGFGFQAMTVLGMTTAALFVMWVADQITTHGIGNGASLIIMINIASRLPTAIAVGYSHYTANEIPMLSAVTQVGLLVIFGFAVVMGTVMLTQGMRKVPIHTTRRSVSGGAGFGLKQTYMPLRVNYTGVMPIIFAQPLISFPAAFMARIDPDATGVRGVLREIGVHLQSGAAHTVVYAVLIVFFAFFWVATQFNAIEISENLKKEGSYVPGIRPGRATAEYLDAVMTRVTLIGATGLLVVALIPELMSNLMGVPWVVSSFFGGTSLLIIVGVALDTLRIMESHLLVRKYEGFLRHGTIHGRR